MRLAIFSAVTLIALACAPHHADAATCGSGPYRAGCVGPNGAAVVRRPAYPPSHRYYPPHRTVTCANGVYRAGCAGPNGAAVVRKPY
jgi:hypothetical protein